MTKIIQQSNILGQMATIYMCCLITSLVVLTALPASAETDSAELVKVEKPTKMTAINLWVDMGLGLISEKELENRLKRLGINFKTLLEKETKSLTADLYGNRQVTGKHFSLLIESMDEISSFHSYTVIGKSANRVYLEAEYFLTGKFSYIVVVSAPLADLPVTTRKKILSKKLYEK